MGYNSDPTLSGPPRNGVSHLTSLGIVPDFPLRYSNHPIYSVDISGRLLWGLTIRGYADPRASLGIHSSNPD